MKVTRNKIILTIAIVAILTLAFFQGGNYAERDSNPAPLSPLEQVTSVPPQASTPSITSTPTSTPDVSESSKTSETPKNTSGTTSKPELKTGSKTQPISEKKDITSQKKNHKTPVKDREISSPGVENGSKSYSQSQGMVIDKKTGKDKYLTNPVPKGKPIPVEPQDVVVSDKAMTCTLSVRCDTILNNIKYLDSEKVELVPLDGVIFADSTVTFYEGESVFNVLQREMKKAKIHMEFENTPIYNSAYIEGINNLYQFDCGELSGWMYKVDGWFPNYGCSRFQLQQGNKIEWVYTCDLGRDVGGFSATGG